jgi:hypothetical protein
VARGVGARNLRKPAIASDATYRKNPCENFVHRAAGSLGVFFLFLDTSDECSAFDSLWITCTNLDGGR